MRDLGRGSLGLQPLLHLYIWYQSTGCKACATRWVLASAVLADASALGCTGARLWHRAEVWKGRQLRPRFFERVTGGDRAVRAKVEYM